MRYEQRLTEKLSANAVTYVPHTGKFYSGSLDLPGMDFTGKHEKNYEPIAVLRKGNLSKDRAAAVEYTNHEMLRRAERAGTSHSASVDNVSLANMTRVELMTEIINRQQKETFLIQGVRPIPVPKLKLDYDIQLHVKSAGKTVGKRQKPHTEAPEFVQASFDMVKFGKLARLIDVADEDELSALISPTSTAIDDVTQAIDQDENILIKNELAKFGGVAKASWSGKNTDANFSANNPLDHITEEIERITKLHGRPKTFVSNLTTLGKYLSNTHLRGYTEALDREGQGVGGLPGFPGIKRITDVDIPTGEAYIYDTRALSYGQGPMVSESFRDALAGVSGHVIRKWVEPLIPTKLKTDFGTKMTGLA